MVTLWPLTRAASTEQDSTGFFIEKDRAKAQLAVSQPRLTLLQPRLRYSPAARCQPAISRQ